MRRISSYREISKKQIDSGLSSYQRHKVGVFYAADKKLNKHIPRTLVGTVHDPKVTHGLTAAFCTRAYHTAGERPLSPLLTNQIIAIVSQ